MSNSQLHPLLQRMYFLIATAGGAGMLRPAPGTWGAGVGAITYLAVACLPSEYQMPTIAILLLLACWGTILVGPWAENHFGKKDPGAVVIDEVAGILLTLLFFHIPGNVWLTLAWAFPVTRLFDIIKLPPARQMEKWPQGWGVLCDDLMSSVYAIATLQFVRWMMPSWFVNGL